MTSLLTNTAAMVALQTLNDINMSLNETNNRVSTGLRIRDAQDSAAYWAIATTTKSDNSALGTVKDALAIGRSTLDVTYSGLESVKDSLEDIKNLLLSVRQPGVDRAKVQTQIAGLITDMQTKAQASVMNEQNFLVIGDSSTFAAGDEIRSVVASFERSAGGTITVSTIDINVETIALVDTAAGAANVGILSKDRDLGGAANAALTTLDISTATYDVNTALGVTALEEAIAAVSAAFDETVTAMNSVGVNLARATSQESFINALIDANDRAVGALVDANMEEESTKLRALQTQQQLAVQSLSIANSASQNVLSLFR